jgi:ankyrin repeat protein
MSDSSNPSAHVNLEFLRKEAKALLRKCRTGDLAATARIQAQLPRFSGRDAGQLASQIKLADVHNALAREQGYSKWTDLKHLDEPLERFLSAVRGGDLKTAQTVLVDSAGVAEDNIHVACVIGDSDAVGRYLALDPERATAEHRGWPPLIYACASPFNRLSSRHAAGVLDCVTVLLSRGVDPGTSTFSNPSDPSSKTTAIARAGMSGNIPVFHLLLARGARPEGVAEALAKTSPQAAQLSEVFKRSFTSQEMRDRMEKQKAEFRGRPPQMSHLPFSVENFYEPEVPRGVEPGTGMGLFLQHGLDPNLIMPKTGEALLHGWSRNGHIGMLETLLAHGADPNLPRADGRTPLALAIMAGNTVAAEILVAHGARPEDVRKKDVWIGACMRADAATAQSVLSSQPELLKEITPEDRELLIQEAGRNRVDRVRVMAQLGFDPGWIGTSGATALHVAAWHGHVEMVRLLLEFRAPVNIRDRTYGSSALAWAAHGSKQCPNPSDENYYAVALALIDAGADRETSIDNSGVHAATMASARVATLLHDRGFRE